MKCILGSSSPRRSELLKMIGLTFSIEKSHYQERAFRNSEDILEYSKELALKKGQEIIGRIKTDLLLSSDTIVEIKGEVLGKPMDKDDAQAMLEKLSGSWHQVITSVAYFKNQKIDHIEAEVSKVWFKQLSADDIDHYLKNAKYLDKAGAYGIQEHGQGLAHRIEGNFSNIVGLPLNRVLDYLVKSFGPNWRRKFE